MATIIDPPNSVWPNGLKVDSAGYVIFYPLGTNKVDISAITWPDGDKLVSPFVYQNDKVVGFVDTKALTVSGTATTTMNYSHIEADFSSIPEGKLTVNTPNATVKEFKWAPAESNYNVTLKYKGCKTVDEVKAVDANYLTTDIVDGVWSEGLGDLENGSMLFFECDNLTTFSSDLSKLTTGYSMFNNCNNLTSFSSDLSSLTDGRNMFHYCGSLTDFDSNLPSLTNAENMFSDCFQLTSFSSNLSSLKDSRNMFSGSSQLTSFSSNLSSLTNGFTMFNSCKLDAPSVKNIIDTINTINKNSGRLSLGIGCNNTTSDKDIFAQEVGYADMTSLLAALKTKGWIVDTEYNGRPATTYGLRRPTEDALPVFVKLEETEDYADYTSMDSFKKYRLNWFHETTGSTEGYTQYPTLEDAVADMRLTKIEKPQMLSVNR